MSGKKIKYSSEDMAALISEVESQFAEHLAKAEKEQDVKTDLKKSAKTSTDNSDESVKDEQEQVVAKSEDKENESADEFDYDEEDLAEMDKMYKSMTKSEVKAHLESLQKAIGDEEQVIAKSEDESEEDSDNDVTDMLKSELSTVKKENEVLKEKSDKLEKSFKDLTAALAKFVKGKAPKQKAITKIEYVAKSEEEVKSNKDKTDVDVSKLSKSEISKRLSEKIRSGKLEKAEREKINDYYINKSDIESIKHLL